MSASDDPFDLSFLQNDEDRYYDEIMGPMRDAVWVEQWWGTAGVVQATSMQEIPAVLIRCQPMQVFGDPRPVTLLIPTDTCGPMGRKLLAFENVTVEDMKRDGRPLKP